MNDTKEERKKAGRPRKEKKDIKKVLSIYLADVEMERVESESKRLGITRSQVIEAVLIKSFAKFPQKREV